MFVVYFMLTLQKRVLSNEHEGQKVSRRICTYMQSNSTTGWCRDVNICLFVYIYIFIDRIGRIDRSIDKIETAVQFLIIYSFKVLGKCSRHIL